MTKETHESSNTGAQASDEHWEAKLSARDSAAFADALLDPKQVNDRLRDTIHRYREKTGA